MVVYIKKKIFYIKNIYVFYDLIIILIIFKIVKFLICRLNIQIKLNIYKSMYGNKMSNLRYFMNLMLEFYFLDKRCLIDRFLILF